MAAKDPPRARGRVPIGERIPVASFVVGDVVTVEYRVLLPTYAHTDNPAMALVITPVGSILPGDSMRLDDASRNFLEGKAVLLLLWFFLKWALRSGCKI